MRHESGSIWITIWMWDLQLNLKIIFCDCRYSPTWAVPYRKRVRSALRRGAAAVAAATGLRNFSKSIHRDRWIDVSSEHCPSIQRSGPDRQVAQLCARNVCTEIVRNICNNNHVVESWLLKFLKIYANDIQIRSNFVCHLEQHIHEDMPNLSPKEASMRKLENADFQMSHHLDCKILERFFRGNVN